MSPVSPGNSWNNVLTLDAQRNIIGGNPQALRDAIQHGADLRIYSEFVHNEHIDTKSSNHDLIQETMDMRVTYLIDGRWCGGILTLRQPVDLPDAFGPRPSLSLFMYNENGEQAIARPHLNGPPPAGTRGPAAVADHSDMPKYHEIDSWDAGSNAPSSNFIYDFEVLRYYVREDWKLMLHHDANGEVISGSRAAVAEAFARGVEWKIGISGLCADLIPADQPALQHDVFIQAGSCYLYTQQGLMIASSHPLARVRPAIPLRYSTGNWDYAWLVARTDGHVAKLVYDPYTLQSSRSPGQHEIRWFCR